ncbi:MAG: excinuclease ABC subunit UvrA, partial [Deltaproteobacteria bacterium]|nr:excinuclease ABC subunit UvrA [Deltaproteobacteria bacterium]
GKSSLAFDTLYAEGQRRYVESLSSYARQFIDQTEKPKVDYIGGLSPAIAIEQKAVSKNPRSTVATVTEIYDYLRVLYSGIGIPHCPKCGKKVKAQSAQEIVEQVAALPPKTRLQIMAPLARNRKGTFKDTFINARSEGFTRVRVNGEVKSLEEEITLDKKKKHNIELVVDRLIVPDENDLNSSFITRLTDSVETALKAGDGLIVVDKDDGSEWLLSELNSCVDCGMSFPRLTPAMFSFNSPIGMCPECNGLGTRLEVDPELFYDPDKTINQGAVRTWGEVGKKTRGGRYSIAKQILEQYGHNLNIRWKDLSKKCQDAILFGGARIVWKWDNTRSSGEYKGVHEGEVNSIRRRYHQTKSEFTRKWYSSFMSTQPCSTCMGKRLRPESCAVTVGDKNIIEVTEMSIGESSAWVRELLPRMSQEEREISEEVLKEIGERLQFLLNVGLHYLTLDRPASTLSGGEGQRIRLASQIGCGLSGVLYVLDEPSIGLHQRDNRRLLDTLVRLRDLGNTVVVVEHDEETMTTADWIVDLGPEAGVNGGWVVAEGPLKTIVKNKKSLTGKYLSGEIKVASPNGKRRPTNGKWITVVDAEQNNLKKLSVRFPLGLFTCVTGVSGSGKSSLVAQTLYPALAKALHNSEERPGKHKRINGLNSINKIINITQSPIGRTPRSNPATYVQLMNHIRDLFAQLPDSRARGYQPGRFSFNVKGGRCESCQGHGKKRVEMHFLADVWVTCNVCKGTRFNKETLQVHYKGKNISDVLDMDVDEALKFFENIPKIKKIIQTLSDVGLGYVKLGQSALTLSGGEAQRVKLAKELARVATGDTVYILDEPTTGLHFADIQKLLDVLHTLTDAGNTIIVIEHNLDVIKTADWIIDLGPEGGDEGGHIVAEGTPEDVAKVEASHTGRFLKEMLGKK